MNGKFILAQMAVTTHRAYKMLISRPVGKLQLGRQDIKVYLKEISCDDGNWTKLAQTFTVVCFGIKVSKTSVSITTYLSL
jgi:hypothetical protein